jgi:aminopeptidase N
MRVLLFVLILLESLFVNAQHQDKVDFKKGKIRITPLPGEKKIFGEVTYNFKALADVDSVFLDARNMSFSMVKLNGFETNYSNTDETITIPENFKKGKSYTLFLDYSVVPKQTVYFMGWEDDIEGNEQIWTQGQGKYTSHWLPSFDVMEEKVEFDMSITFDDAYEVVANGKREAVIMDSKSQKTWQFGYGPSHEQLSFGLCHRKLR